MECMSCGAEIPPEWKAAIANNCCPKCGDQIMSDKMVSLTNELSDVLKSLVEEGGDFMDKVLDMCGLMRKPLPGEKKLEEKNEVNLPENFKVPQNTVQDFLRRTNAPHLADRQAKIAAMRSHIESAQASGSDPDFEGFAEDPSPETQGVIKAKDFVEGSHYLNDDGSAPSVNELSEAIGDSSIDDYDPNIPVILQKDRLARLEKSRGISSGGVGNFRRSD